MIRQRIKYLLYPLGIYTSYVGVTHILTQRQISSRSDETPGEDKFQHMRILGRFENPFKEYRPQTLYEFFVMRIMELYSGDHGSLHDTQQEIVSHLGGYQHVDINQMLKQYDESINFTWIGQSTSIVCMPKGGPKILLDPLFENHLMNKLGPKRILPTPLTIDELVQHNSSDDAIDYVVVSHDHPDHLESSSVEKIGNSTKWIVPFGVGKFLSKHDVTNFIEMKWWETQSLGDGYEIVCLPTMHWSGRYLYDANLSLWCSFLITKDGKSLFYHGGDTGYVEELFKSIGSKFGPVEFAALPIGQYCPQWHQAPRHISPQESIQICEDMQIKNMVGVHWGTFVLSSENYWEPGKLLNDLSKEVESTNAMVPILGESMKIKIS